MALSFRLNSFMVLVLLGLFGATGLFSCKENGDYKRLLHAEAILDSMPDSARSLLSGISYDKLNNRSRALYTLVDAEIKYKSFVISTEDSLLRIAANTFDKLGDKDRLMRTLFQMSLNEYYALDYAEAILSATEAMHLANELNSHLYIARTCEQVATLYNNNFNFEDALPYILRTIEEYKLAGKERNLEYATVDKASILRNLKRYDEALGVLDSLSNIISSSNSDSSLIRYSSYAKLDLLTLKNDPKRVRAIADSIMRFTGPSSHVDAKYFISARVTCGDLDEAKRIIDSLRRHQPSWDRQARILKGIIDYNIAIGHTDSALEYSNMMIDLQQDGISRVFNGGLQKAQVSHLSTKYALAQEHNSAMRVVFFSVALSLIFIIGVIGYVFRLRMKRQKEIIDNKMGEISELFSSQNTRLAHLFSNRVEIINGICERYFTEKGVKDVMRAKLYREVCGELKKLNSTESVEEIVRFLNDTRNNIVMKLDEIPGIKDTSRIVAIFSILGLTPKAVSILCEISASNVYTLRSRLKDLIETSDSKNKRELIGALSLK
ncbi:MAG: hypothetical protein K2M06_06210 [Muribaculaceae bacterium]|nr:hypothetical protein [Muribaculaceae bacterium]